MNYTITLYNKWKRPYFYGPKNNDDSTCIQTDTVSYVTDKLDLCKIIITDLLDVPETALTLEEVKKQFSSPHYSEISEEKLVAILNFYNGRLALHKTIVDNIELLHKLDCLDNCHILKYDIPYEYNHFIVEDSDVLEEQIDAYIELKIEKEEEKEND